jgi:hypothetical protein
LVVAATFAKTTLSDAMEPTASSTRPLMELADGYACWACGSSSAGPMRALVGGEQPVCVHWCGGIVIGVVAAIASIPDDPQPSGALFWLALWLSLGLLSVPIFRASTDMSVLLRTEHF